MNPARTIPMLATALLATGAAADRVTYMTTTLEVRTGEIVGMSGSALIVQHGEGAPERVPMERVATIDAEDAPMRGLPTPRILDDEELIYVDLIDGQRLVLSLRTDDDTSPDDADVLAGRAWDFGTARIPLERILRIARPGAPATPEPTLTDRVVLSNGDELTGFVARVGTTVEIERDDGTVTTVELARVANLQLANPPEPEPGVFISDSSGKVVRARTFAVNADRTLRITADGASLGIESHGEDETVYQPRGVRFTGARVSHADTRIVDLASIQPERHLPTGDRSWTRAPEPQAGTTAPDSIGDVYLPAPASVFYALPRGARRFACEIAHRGGGWTDCTATVFAERRDGSRVELGAVRLSGTDHTPGQTVGSIAADLPIGAVTLVLAVDPGRYGAVQDAVVFRDARLLVTD